jgi:hypothetical protein
VSYDAAGTVSWVNEAFKQTLHLPYLKRQALQSQRPGCTEAIYRRCPASVW